MASLYREERYGIALALVMDTSQVTLRAARPASLAVKARRALLSFRPSRPGVLCPCDHRKAAALTVVL